MIYNKKAQNSTIGVVIAIVLGVALIVFLIWGFSTNWSMFSSTSSAYAGQVNIDSIKQACQIQCENKQIGEYCTSKKIVTYVADDEKKKESLSCIEMMEAGIISLSCDIECSGKCSGTPTTPEKKDNADVPCSDKGDAKSCKGYPGCIWKYTAA